MNIYLVIELRTREISQKKLQNRVLRTCNLCQKIFCVQRIRHPWQPKKTENRNSSPNYEKFIPGPMKRIYKCIEAKIHDSNPWQKIHDSRSMTENLLQMNDYPWQNSIQNLKGEKTVNGKSMTDNDKNFGEKYDPKLAQRWKQKWWPILATASVRVVEPQGCSPA